jgi:hypothetical protein
MSTVKKCHLRPILGCFKRNFVNFAPSSIKLFLTIPPTPLGFLNKLRVRLDKVSKPKFRKFLLRATTRGSAFYDLQNVEKYRFR